MAEEPENLTIRLLRELRGEVQELRADLTNRIDGNTVILNMLAGLLHDHEQRLDAVEKR
jgi:hypothetical protein